MNNAHRIFLFVMGLLTWAFVIVPWLGLTGAPNMLLSMCVGYGLMSWAMRSWK